MKIDNKIQFFFLLAILFGFVYLIPSDLLSEEQDKINEILILGNRRVETDLIRSQISISSGDTLSSDSVSNVIKSIYRLGLFDDVTAEIVPSDDGVNIIFVVKEKPVIIDLRIIGNDKIKSEDILGAISLKEGDIIEISKLNKSIESINKLYSDKGIIPTEVEYSIDPRGEGTVGLNFDIKEGKKAFIKKVVVKGNEIIKSDQIKDKIYSKPKNFFSFISQRGLYKPEEIDRDSDRIKFVYLDEGFLDVKVSKPETIYNEEEEGYIVTFRIEEGQQYKVGNIRIGGDLITEEEELINLLNLKVSEVFKSSYVSQDINILTTYYGNQGYAFANVDPKIVPDAQALLVDVSFIIEKGKEIYVRKIDITGNVRTRDKVIRREIQIQEQSLYNASEVQSIKRRVFRTGFFEDNVEVETQRVIDVDDQVDINVHVDEKPTGFFSVAGGFSSVETILFSGQIQESNLLGYGKRLSLSSQLGGVTKIFSLLYSDPVFLDSEWNFNINLFLTDREFRDFERKSLGGTITFGRRLFDNFRGEVGYRFEDQKIDGVTGDAKLVITESKRTISSFQLGLVWDTRNNLLDPTAGTVARSVIEYAGPFGGDTDFIKYIANVRYFYPLWKDTVLSLTGLYGYLNLMDVGNDLVVGERFFLGGPRTLRGYKFRRVGPRVPTDDGGYVIIGGTQELMFSAEYLVPLVKSLNLKGVLFVDVGNAFNDNEDLSINPDNLRKDVGFGFRWISPLGPLQLDLGIPIGEKLSGEDDFEIQFGIGNVF